MPVNCQFCGKELKAKNQQGVDMHENSCKENPKNKKQGEGKPMGENKVTCPECKSANGRLLKPSNDVEAVHIKNGQTYVCVHCWEVW